MRNLSLIASCVFAFGLAVHSASASPITWSNKQDISGPGSTAVSTVKAYGGPGNGNAISTGTNDVNTQGLLVLALNYSGVPFVNFPYDAVINGQTFLSYNVGANLTQHAVTYSDSLTTTGAFWDTPGAAGQSYGLYNQNGYAPQNDYTLGNGRYTASTAATITLSNLTLGQQYLVQFWVTDPRGGGKVPTRTESISATVGDTNVQTLVYGSSSTGEGQWVTGTFVADSSLSETLNLLAGNSNPLSGDAGSAQVNLIQLRAVPEPSSFILCGLGALGLLAVARRRRKA